MKSEHALYHNDAVSLVIQRKLCQGSQEQLIGVVVCLASFHHLTAQLHHLGETD